MKEQQIQKKIINYLEDEGYYVVKVVIATKAGVPDILACVNGKFIGIEVKTPNTKTNISSLQEYNLDKIHYTGGKSLVAWNVDMVKDFINDNAL